MLLPAKMRTGAHSLIGILQWIGFVFPVILGQVAIAGAALGLDRSDLEQLLARVLIVSGVATTLQTLLFHRLPVFEAPAAVYLAAVLVASSTALAVGMPQAELLAGIKGGLLVGGTAVVVLSALRVTGWLTRLFTRFVTAVFLVTLGAQLTVQVLPMAIGRVDDSPLGSGLAWLTLGCMLLVFLVVKRLERVQQFSLIAAVAAGWALHAGLSPEAVNQLEPLRMSMPELQAWGSPGLKAVVLVPMAVAAGFAVMNALASLQSMAMVQRKAVTSRQVNRGVFASGFANLAMGWVGGLGTAPHASSAGLVKITGLQSRYLLSCAGGILVLIACVPGLVQLLASLPTPVAGTLIVITVWVLFVTGARELLVQWRDAHRRWRVVGVGIGTVTAAGVGLARPPWIPELAVEFLGIPLLMATLLALALEVYERMSIRYP